MWHTLTKMKRILPVQAVDYFSGWENDITIMTFLEREYDLRYTNEPSLVFCHQFGVEHHKFSCPKILCCGEPWGFDPNDYDLILSFEYDESEKAVRFPLYGYYYPVTTLCKCMSRSVAMAILRNKKRFCNFVYSNGGPQDRILFMELLSKYKTVDCCGHVCNNTGFFVEGEHSSSEKISFLSDYKFTICFENTIKSGYTSEKIAGPMAANSIPIYYGNSEVWRDFNTKSFVNVHDYDSFENAVAKIIELDRDDDQYVDMMTEPWFHDNIPTQYVDTNLLVSRLVRWIEQRNLSLAPETVS